jgi:hypothetical protein
LFIFFGRTSHTAVGRLTWRQRRGLAGELAERARASEILHRLIAGVGDGDDECDVLARDSRRAGFRPSRLSVDRRFTKLKARLAYWLTHRLICRRMMRILDEHAIDLLHENRSILYLFHEKLYLAASGDVVGIDFFGDGLVRFKEAGFSSGQ